MFIRICCLTDSVQRKTPRQPNDVPLLPPITPFPLKLGPVSWSFDKNALAGSGYSIEPEKVVRLPEGASASFSASFQAR